MDLAPTPLQDALRAQAREALAASTAPSWGELAALGWTGVSLEEAVGGAGLGLLEEVVLHEEAGRAVLHAPFWSTARLAPLLPETDRRRVAAGTASWTLADGPLVADLDTATHVAVLGGDTVWELEGAAREVLPTIDGSRPLGVVVGGDVGRRLFPSELLPQVRLRGLVTLAFEALGAGTQALALGLGREGASTAAREPLAQAWVSLELARSLAWWAAWALAEGDPSAATAAAAAKAAAADAAVDATQHALDALGVAGRTWESHLRRLHARALWIRAWEASGEQLRAEVAAQLLDAR